MNDQQIQLGLHLMQLVSDRLFFLRGDSHPHAICGAGFLMALLHGKEFVTNAEVVEALHTVYETLPQAIGVMDYLTLKPEQFDTMTLQLLDLLHGMRYVPETGNFLVFQDFYNNL